MMSNGDKRKVFAEQLIEHLDKYIHSGFFGLISSGPAHQQLALKMKLEAKNYINHPTDENWGIFVSAFKAFHETLEELKSQSLLPAMNNVIKNSAFPDIINVITDFNQLNAGATILKADLKIQKPSAELVMADLSRQLPLSISIEKAPARPLTDFVHIETEAKTNKCVITSVLIDEGHEVYADVPNTPNKAEKALEAVTKELGTYLDKDKQDMLHKVVPFLCQQGVLEQGLVDLMRLLKVRIHLDSTQGPANALPINSIDNLTEQDIAVSDASSLTLSAPKHNILLNVSKSGLNITETYYFEKYRVTDERGDLREHSFTTPVKVIDRFTCDVSDDGNSATIKNRQIEFSASHETPKQVASETPRPKPQ
ncbi:MAG: hypothetical protein ACHQAX_06025 [Gammaproteobacteria bacterium]